MTGWPTITDHIDWQSHSFCQNFVAANKERCAALGLTPAIPDVVSGTIVGNHAFWAALQQWCLNNCGNFVPAGVSYDDTVLPIPNYTETTFNAAMTYGGFRRLLADGVTWTTGIMQKGDIFRRHIWDDLITAYNLLRWTENIPIFIAGTGESKYGHSFFDPYYSGFLSWAAAKGSAESDFHTVSFSGIEAYSDGTWDPVLLVYVAETSRSSGQAQIDMGPLLPTVAYSAEFYLQLSGEGYVTFDTNGDFAFSDDGKIHLVDTEAGAPSTAATSILLGGSGIPNWCDDPSTVYPVFPSRGYSVEYCIVILKFDGSFAYLP